MESVSCNLCGSEDYKILFSSPDFIFPKPEKFRVVGCVKCGLVFINPRPDKSEIGSYYPAEYFRPYEEIQKDANAMAIQESKAKIAGVKKGGRVLDIGCGMGEFLSKMKDKGWNVFGVEVSPIASCHAREKMGLKNIYNQDILEFSFSDELFDMISLWYVIEHLGNPLITLKKAHSLLKPNGVLIITCPNFNSPLRKLFGNKWYPLDSPRHLYQFTLGTLREMFEASGFEITRVIHNPFLVHSMSCMKLSIFRWLGFKGFLYSDTKSESRPNKKRAGLIFLEILRNYFNLACYGLTIILTLLRSGDDLCIKARKI
jgi:SAM-dependent methyltransferase